MNNNERDRYRSDRNNYSSHRSERYRHPYRDAYRYDNYGDAAHGGYGNESYAGTYGNQGDEGAGHRSRNVANRGMSTYDTSRNYGNMGSYGGAQGFGSTRGGFSSQRTSHPGSQFDSGHGLPPSSSHGHDTDQPRRYGYQSDYDSHGQNADNFHYERSNSNRYSDYPTRRYQDKGQGNTGYERDNYRQGGSGSDSGNYMGSGYERTPRPSEYGSTRGDYGSSGYYMGSRQSGSSYNQPYGMSGYYQGGYYDDTDYNSYARDRDERSNDW